MELADYLRLLRRRWIFLVVGVLAGLAGGYQVAHSQVQTYRSTLRVFVASAQSSTGLLDTLAQVASSGPVVGQAQALSGGTAGVSVDASSGGSSALLQINVTSTDPRSAVGTASAYTQVLPAAYAQLNSFGAVTLQRLDQSGATPVPLHRTRTIGIGALLGLLAGLVAALVREALDTAVRDEEELGRRLEVQVIGSVPGDKLSGVVSLTAPRSPRAEAYRRIAVALRLTDTAERPLRSLLVTSAVTGEGKTTTAVNVALAASRAGERVLLVDADLRRPAVARQLGIDAGPGLAELLQGTQEAAGCFVEVEGLMVLPGGRTPSTPVELLRGATLRELIASATQQYDLVVVDGPALLPTADAELLAAVCEGVIVVSRMSSTPRALIGRAQRTLRSIGADVIGAVANFTTEAEPLPPPLKSSGRHGLLGLRHDQAEPTPPGPTSRADATLRRAVASTPTVAVPLPLEEEGTAVAAPVIRHEPREQRAPAQPTVAASALGSAPPRQPPVKPPLAVSPPPPPVGASPTHDPAPTPPPPPPPPTHSPPAPAAPGGGALARLMATTLRADKVEKAGAPAEPPLG